MLVDDNSKSSSPGDVKQSPLASASNDLHEIAEEMMPLNHTDLSL